MINGVNHITLAVSDLTRSLHFYSKVLDLRLIAKWDKGAYLLAGDMWLAISQEECISPYLDYTHIAFNLDEDDFKRLVDKLRANNIEEFKENTSEGDSFYFCDPDGHKLELHYNNIRDRLKWANEIEWSSFEIVDDEYKEGLDV